jgi:hypothetical protein
MMKSKVISSISAKKNPNEQGNNYLLPHITEHNKKTLTYGSGNLGSGLEQTQQYGGVELVHGISVLPS